MDSTAKSKESRRLGAVLQVGGFVVAVLAVGVTAFFGVRSERSKELEVNFLGRLSLIRTDRIGGTQIRVLYGEDDIKNLTKFSLRIRNAGQLPIEARDIEQPVRLQFGRDTRVLEAEVVATYPKDLAVEPVPLSGAVVVKHGLLNTGDYIELNVLVDGRDDWPSVTFRISGVAFPKEVYATDTAEEMGVTMPALPWAIEVAVLTVASVVVAAIIGAAITLFLQYVRYFFTAGIRTLAANAVREARKEEGVPKRDLVARKVYFALPVGPDTRAQERIRQIDVDVFAEDDETVIREVVAAISPSTFSERLAMFSTEGLASIGLAIAGACLLTVVAGAWARL